MSGQQAPWNCQDQKPHFSLAHAETESLPASGRMKVIPKSATFNSHWQGSEQLGPITPAGMPECYGRELARSDQVPPGQPEHQDAKTFYSVPLTSQIKDHPCYPGPYAAPTINGRHPPAVSQVQQSTASERESDCCCCVVM